MTCTASATGSSYGTDNWTDRNRCEGGPLSVRGPVRFRCPLQASDRCQAVELRPSDEECGNGRPRSRWRRDDWSSFAPFGSSRTIRRCSPRPAACPRCGRSRSVASDVKGDPERAPSADVGRFAPECVERPSWPLAAAARASLLGVIGHVAMVPRAGDLRGSQVAADVLGEHVAGSPVVACSRRMAIVVRSCASSASCRSMTARRCRAGR